jgi:Predicted nucleic acid-binding protein, contains PIN domain
MDKIYVDCNILLDWLIDREPFSIYASRLITLIENKKIKGYISPLTLSNTYYILASSYNKKLAYEFIEDCARIFTILDVTDHIVRQAISKKHKDFEDDLHYFTAKMNGISKIITRNKKDFLKGELGIYNAEEYLRRF